MRSIKGILCVAAGLLWHSAAPADEQEVRVDDSATTPGVTTPVDTRYLDALNRGPYYSSTWSSSLIAADLLNDGTDWTYAMPSVDFLDNSTFGRAAKLRNLSLLTLAEVGKGRLFFGVNDDGLVGLHFKALTADSDLRYLEVARLPYLEEEDEAQETLLPDID